MSDAHAGPGAGTVSAFSDSSDGTLSPIGSSPFPDNQTAPCWVESTQDGQFRFTMNTASGTISRYSIAPAGTLTLLANTQVGATGGLGAVDARLSQNGAYLFVDESRIGAVGAFAVHAGDLTDPRQLAASLPASATPAGIVVT